MKVSKLRLKCCIESLYIDIILKRNKITILSQFLVKNLKLFFWGGFLSRTFTNHRTTGEGEGYFINSSLPLPPTSQTLRHYPGNYCRELTSAHSQQPYSNREPLVSERKSLTTKLFLLSEERTLCVLFCVHYLQMIKQKVFLLLEN